MTLCEIQELEKSYSVMNVANRDIFNLIAEVLRLRVLLASVAFIAEHHAPKVDDRHERDAFREVASTALRGLE